MADGGRQKDERARIAGRIRALLSKTVENGCTEAEALSAAALAAELLARHEMDLDEAELRATPFGEREYAEPDAVGERLWRPASAIARMTHCRYWRSGAGVNPVVVTFLGLEHEVEIAGYLLAICARAMRDELARLDKAIAIKTPDFRRRQRNAFLDGMADTLQRRIEAMIRPEPTGKGLVVVRDQLVEAELDRRGHKLADMRAGMSRDFDPAYDDGRVAGERVALDPGVEGPDVGRVRIGRGSGVA